MIGANSSAGSINYKEIYDLLDNLCQSLVGAKDNHSMYNSYLKYYTYFI